MNGIIGTIKEVDNLDHLPSPPLGLKYFVCLGGAKNYQCFLESTNLSRSDFMKKYRDCLDTCLSPIYEDNEFIVTQDAQIAIPGFYIVATKAKYIRLNEMSNDSIKKCSVLSALIRKGMKTRLKIEIIHEYYEEHLGKPSSTHFWLLPIYKEVFETHKLKSSIKYFDIWKYQNLFKFKQHEEAINDNNRIMKSFLLEYTLNLNI